MVTIKAQFDGDRVILPSGFKARRTDDITVSFPDEAVLEGAVQTEKALVSIWDIIGKHTSSQTVEEITQEIRRDRETWDMNTGGIRGER